MLEFIQPSRISTEPWFNQYIHCSFWYQGRYRTAIAVLSSVNNGEISLFMDVFF